MKLSLISITYNNLDGLKKTLSVFEKNRFKDQIEIVIIDGGSKDGTFDFLKTQTLTENWISEKDAGIYNAMNKGLLRAHGDYIWFLNSGDYVENEDVLHKVLYALDGKNDAVYGETMMVDSNGKHLGTRSEISTRKLPQKLTWKSLRMGMVVSHQSFIVKRNLAVTYDENYKYVSDIDWMISTLKNCKIIKNLHSVIACFTMDGFSSQQRNNSNKERYSVLKKHYGFIPNGFSHLGILFRKILNSKKV